MLNDVELAVNNATEKIELKLRLWLRKISAASIVIFRPAIVPR